MKTKFFVFAVALAAMLPFASCSDDELTDEDLSSKILSYSSYVGVDNGNDENTIEFKSGGSYVWQYYDKVDGKWYTFSEGIWVVKGGNLVLTDEDGSFTGTISDEGKKLSFVDGDYSVTFQKK